MQALPKIIASEAGEELSESRENHIKIARCGDAGRVMYDVQWWDGRGCVCSAYWPAL